MGIVLGFDSAGTKSDDELKTLATDGFKVALFYLGGPEAAVTHSYGYARKLREHGMSLLPVYVGLQANSLTGVSDETAQSRGKASAVDAAKLLAKLREHVPHATYLPLTFDWEGELTAEGATYVRACFDNAEGRNYLYRTDAGVDTPEREVWLAKPTANTSTNAEPLVGTSAGYGHVVGVQFKWLPDIDYSVWDETVIPTAEPVKSSNLKKHRVDADVKLAETELGKVAHLSHPTKVMGRLAAVVAAGQTLLLSVQSGNPTTKGEVIAGVGTVGWALIQEVFTAVGVKPSTITAAYRSYKAAKGG